MSNKAKKQQLGKATKAAEDEKHWQINPLEYLDDPTKWQDYKSRQDARLKNGKSGFDEWSVSWP